MRFHELPADVICSIFNFCDIHAVVSVSGTSKYLHRLVKNKSVWVYLVDDLRHRGFIDQLSLSDIQSYSQGALVSLVKGLLTGPESWTGTTNPRSHPPQTIHPPSMPGLATLLQGGEYILFSNNRTLECWSVRYDKLVWVYQSGPKPRIYEYDAEVIDGGAGANIIICDRDTKLGPRLQIVKLDFGSGISTLLFLIEAPGQWSCRFSAPKICGDIAVVYFSESGGQSSGLNPRLVNWKTKDHLELTSPTSRLAVIPILNYTLVLSNPLSGGSEVIILENSAFSSHWCDVATHPRPSMVPISELEFLLQESITFSDLPSLTVRRTRIFAYESPLQEESYRVWVVMCDGRSFLEDETRVICSYHLSLPTPLNRITWRQRTVAVSMADSCFPLPSISYSGHRICRSSNRYCVLEPSGTAEVNISDTGVDSDLSYNHVSTYSGALTCVDNTDHRVLISYYK
ncbi:hypothetical protein C8R45DRAFT_994210 [Mycena sanguinolenta]|nr:hypothetical protein C8R45DRAFT_994210 [Mycena sanguinolenta]